jgi:hypothetical protein
MLFVCIKRSWRIPLGLLLVVLVTIAWCTVVCVLFYLYDVKFW